MVAPPARSVSLLAICRGVGKGRWNLEYSSQKEGSETVASKNEVRSWRKPIIDSGTNRPPKEPYPPNEICGGLSVPSDCRIGIYGVPSFSNGVTGDLAIAPGPEERQPLVAELMIKALVCASELYVEGQVLFVPDDGGVIGVTSRALAGFCTLGPGMRALVVVLRVNLRRMTLLEGTLKVGSVPLAIGEKKQRRCSRDRSMVATPCAGIARRLSFVLLPPSMILYRRR